jgi:hypothetical protein
MASTAYTGYRVASPAVRYATQNAVGYRVRGVATFRYKLACLDAAGARQTWESNVLSTVDAPVTGGVTLPYDATTLTIEGRF